MTNWRLLSPLKLTTNRSTLNPVNVITQTVRRHGQHNESSQAVCSRINSTHSVTHSFQRPCSVTARMALEKTSSPHAVNKNSGKPQLSYQKAVHARLIFGHSTAPPPEI